MKILSIPSQLHLIKYEPHFILLYSPSTRATFKLEKMGDRGRPALSHSIIADSIQFKGGILYEQEITSLEKELEDRKKDSEKVLFSEEELVNTFEDIIDFVLEGKEYGQICSSNIIMTKEDKIKLRDNRIQSEKREYYGEGTSSKDENALGLLMVECCLLKPLTEIKELVKDEQQLIKRLQGFSNKFISAILILLNSFKHFQKFIFSDKGNQGYMGLLARVGQVKEEQMAKQERKRQVFKRKIILVPPLKLKLLAPEEKGWSPKENKFTKERKQKGERKGDGKLQGKNKKSIFKPIRISIRKY